MATLSDVARRAGVSVTTVSRVLNNDPRIRVRDDTRARVLRIAEQMNYSINHAARSLRLARSGTIALIVPDVNSAIFAEMMRGVEDGAAEHDSIVLLGREERIRPGSDLLRRLAGEGRVDGFLLQRRDDVDDRTLQRLVEHEAPVVLVNSNSPARHASVSLDDVAGARLATDYLIGLGHRRIGLVTGVRTSATARKREEGFRASLHAAGLRRREAWTRRLGYEPEDGRTALLEMMATDNRPTAVFVANVNAAIGVLGAARELGISVPGDLSVIACHDIWLAGYTWPPLTTVRMPLYELGHAAAALLAEHLASGTTEHRTITSPAPELLPRASTAPPP